MCIRDRFYAATGEGIKLLEGVSGRRVVLALTDGMDNNGQMRLQETIARGKHPIVNESF